MGADPRRLAIASFLLGFALSGFLDGIVLHQVLQWHHLLSALDGDLRFQIAADGWFHVAMYAVAALGLAALWRARQAASRPGAGRGLATWGLLGFGAWHVVDAVGSHWLLGIHRIRMDVEVPLLWDLGWLAAFGLAPIGAAWFLHRRGGGGSARAGAAMLVLATLAAGGWAGRGPGDDVTIVVFARDVPLATAMARAGAVGDGIIWSQPISGIFAIAGADRLAAWRLYGQGAIFIGGAATPVGCLGWTVPT